MPYYISKILYLSYLRCPKLFWHAVNSPSVIPPPDTSARSRMEEGQAVEKCARHMFSPGTTIDHAHGINETLALSHTAISRAEFNRPILSALVTADDLICEVDILLPMENGDWDLYEVKASTKWKDEFMPDIAFQLHVMGIAGLSIRKPHLVLLNGAYKRKGDIDPKALFRIGDIEETEEHVAEVAGNLVKARNIAGLPSCPDIPIGAHCKNPEDCPMKSICWKEVDAIPNNVFSLYRIRTSTAAKWYGQGIRDNSEIPIDYKFTDKQRIQVKAEKSGTAHINKAGLRAFLDRLEWPVYFLDFETFSSAIPVLENSSPYQVIPFQFSLHVLSSVDARPIHHSWLWDGITGDRIDPRKELLTRLKTLLGNTGSVVAYNAGFEQGVLLGCCEGYPDYGEWLETITPRIVDLLKPFRGFLYYHPSQHGSASLKRILPALTGLSYDGLEIGNGDDASLEYMRVFLGGGNEVERASLRGQLLTYCGLDTGGLVEVVRALRKMAGYA